MVPFWYLPFPYFPIFVPLVNSLTYPRVRQGPRSDSISSKHIIVPTVLGGDCSKQVIYFNSFKPHNNPRSRFYCYLQMTEEGLAKATITLHRTTGGKNPGRNPQVEVCLRVLESGKGRRWLKSRSHIPGEVCCLGRQLGKDAFS